MGPASPGIGHGGIQAGDDVVAVGLRLIHPVWAELPTSTGVRERMECRVTKLAVPVPMADLEEFLKSEMNCPSFKVTFKPMRSPVQSCKDLFDGPSRTRPPGGIALIFEYLVYRGSKANGSERCHPLQSAAGSTVQSRGITATRSETGWMSFKIK